MARPRAPDPHNLRAMTSAMPAPVIETDRPCLGCGYNLRGLRAGINCPECGMPSVMPDGIDDPLALMPRSVILAFIWGCWTASICVVCVIGAVIAMRIPGVDPAIPRWALAGLSLVWVAATWLLTPAFSIPQAVYRGFATASKVRKAARILPWGWVLCASCAVTLELSTRAIPILAWGVWIGFFTGMAGIIALCVLMERLADWTRDDIAQTMFNWAMWGLPILTTLLMLDLPIFRMRWAGGGLFWIGGGLIPLIWLIVAALFPYGLLTLSKSVTLSIVHSFEHEERNKRREERTKKYHRQVGTLVKKMDRARNNQP